MVFVQHAGVNRQAVSGLRAVFLLTIPRWDGVPIGHPVTAHGLGSPGYSVTGIGNRLFSPSSQKLTAFHTQSLQAEVHLASTNFLETVKELGKQKWALGPTSEKSDYWWTAPE